MTQVEEKAVLEEDEHYCVNCDTQFEVNTEYNIEYVTFCPFCGEELVESFEEDEDYDDELDLLGDYTGHN
jgi:predicted RNA-binding Zn-ribbon protein involved in translation (DUF1610 family)